MPKSVAYNMDCLEAMKQMPDNAFDLAVVDPPYGDGCSQSLNVERERERESGVESLRSTIRQIQESKFVERTGGTWAAKYAKKIIAWDVAPEKEYFDQLFRISRNQIIWGGNYFSLPPTRCFLVWRKLTISEAFSMAMCEYAWTSFNENAKLFECAPQGKPGDRFHPTQKPIGSLKTTRTTATRSWTHISAAEAAESPRTTRGWSLSDMRSTRRIFGCRRNALRGTRRRCRCSWTK